MHPKAYTYQVYDEQSFCQIGLSPIAGSSNQYRLGTIFLRNFYTFLDYEKDQIGLGINKGCSTAQLIGKTEHTDEDLPNNPNGGVNKTTPLPTKIDNNGTIIGVFIGVFCFFNIAAAGAYFYFKKRDEKRKQ